MLHKIEIENFMSLKRATIELEPLTVFVGRNSAGKSAIFKALVALARLTGERTVPLRGKRGEFALELGVSLDDLVWRGDAGLPIIFRVWFDDSEGEPDYIMELTKSRVGWAVSRERIQIGSHTIEVNDESPFEHETERRGPQVITTPMIGTLRWMVGPFIRDEKARPAIEPVLENAKRFGEAWRYRPSAFDIAAFDTREFVSTNGRGLAPVLQTLQGKKREVFERIEDSLKRAFPHVRTIGFDRGPQGVRLSFMTRRSDRLLPAPQEADGVLLAPKQAPGDKIHAAEPEV